MSGPSRSIRGYPFGATVKLTSAPKSPIVIHALCAFTIVLVPLTAKLLSLAPPPGLAFK